MAYDKNNIFAKILRGEIPLKSNEKIYENEFVLSFYDINPRKKIHALVIPKGEYTDLDDFSKRATEKEIAELIKGINVVAKKLGKRVLKVTTEAQEKSGDLNKYLIDIFKNHKLTKIFQRENFEKRLRTAQDSFDI